MNQLQQTLRYIKLKIEKRLYTQIKIMLTQAVFLKKLSKKNLIMKIPIKLCNFKSI
ncbi:unnamed protein product [Paramecium sonneborni]|uniref:Uncharacterized protein n=1 Tax=Paramecium sonneborni TaxID=65129 RepID=A0A8S1NJ61_9CILI|nr:unnamed protein product [Paramecium sonneborni]